MTNNTKVALIVMALFLLFIGGRYYWGLSTFKNLQGIKVEHPKAISSGSAEPLPPWDQKITHLYDFVQKIETDSGENSYSGLFPMAPSYKEDLDSLKKAAPFLIKARNDFDLFRKAFAPSRATIEELETGKNLLKGHYSFQSFSRATRVPAYEAIRLREEGQYEKAAETLAAMFIASQVMTRGISADQNLIAAMIGLSSTKDALHCMARIFFERNLSQEQEKTIVLLCQRLRPVFQKYSAILKGEREFGRRIIALTRKKLGFFCYHRLYPFYANPSTEYERHFGRQLRLVSYDPWKTLYPLDKFLDNQSEREFHPLAATVIPNSRAAWLRFLSTEVLLDLLPLLPKVIRRHSSGPLDFITALDFSELSVPTDPFTGAPVRMGTKPGGIRFLIGPIKGRKAVHREFKEDTVVFEYPQTPRD